MNKPKAPICPSCGDPMLVAVVMSPKPKRVGIFCGACNVEAIKEDRPGISGDWRYIHHCGC